MAENSTKLTPSDLAALMCARICHDLVSPVGALSTAIEVLDDPANEEMHDDALDLVRMSARQAAAKLQFLRLAFGAGTSAPGFIGVEEIRKLADGMYGDGKISLSWDIRGDGLEKTRARLLLNMIMIGSYCIPRGGTLDISANESGDASLIELKATGMRARLDPMVPKTLSGKAPEDGFDGRSIQPFYAGMIIRELKGRIDTDHTDDIVTLSAFIPRDSAQNAA